MVKENFSDNNSNEKDYRKGLDSGIQTYRELNAKNLSLYNSPTYGIEWDDSSVDTSTIRRRKAYNYSENNFNSYTRQTKANRQVGPLYVSAPNPLNSPFGNSGMNLNSAMRSRVPNNRQNHFIPSRNCGRTNINALRGGPKSAYSRESYQLCAAHCRGLECLKKNEWDRAVSEFSACIKLNPTDLRSLSMRAKAFIRLARYEPAIEDYSSIINMAPVNDEVLNNRAIAYENVGMFVKAIEDYTSVIELVETITFTAGVQAHIRRGKCYLKLNQLKEALSDFDHAISVDPRYVEGYRQRARTYELMGNYTLAVEDHHIIFNLENMGHRGTQKQSLLDRARALRAYAESIQQKEVEDFNLSQVEEGRVQVSPTSILSIRRVDTLSWPWIGPCSSWPCWNAACDCIDVPPFHSSNAERQIMAAIDDYSTVLNIDVTCEEAMRYRGRSYQSVGLLQEALRDYNGVIELHDILDEDEEGVWIRLERASVHCKLGHSEDAIQELSLLVSAIVNDNRMTDKMSTSGLLSVVYFGRACLLSEKGQYHDAVIDLDKAILLDETRYGSESCNENRRMNGLGNDTKEVEIFAVSPIIEGSDMSNPTTCLSPWNTPMYSVNPKDSLVRSLILRARMHLKANKCDAAIVDYEKVLSKLDESNAIATEELAHAQKAQSKLQAALVQEAYDWLVNQEEKESEAQKTQMQKKSKKNKKKKRKSEKRKKLSINSTNVLPPLEVDENSSKSRKDLASEKSLSARDDACETMLVCQDAGSGKEFLVNHSSDCVADSQTVIHAVDDSEVSSDPLKMLSLHDGTQQRMQQRILERQVKEKRRRQQGSAPMNTCSSTAESSIKESNLSVSDQKEVKVLVDHRYLKKRAKQIENLRSELVAASKSKNYDVLVKTIGRVQRKHMYEALHEEYSTAKVVLDKLEKIQNSLSQEGAYGIADSAKNSESSAVAVMNSPVKAQSSASRVNSKASIASPSPTDRVVFTTFSSDDSILHDKTAFEVVMNGETKSQESYSSVQKVNQQIRSLKRIHRQDIEEKNAEISMLRSQLHGLHLKDLSTYGTQTAIPSFPGSKNFNMDYSISGNIIAKSCSDLCKVFVSRVSSTNFAAFERIDGLISWLSPSIEAEQHRHEVVSFVNSILVNALQEHRFQFLPTGSYPLKTYLPDGDLDATIVFSQSPPLGDKWYLKVVQALCCAASSCNVPNNNTAEFPCYVRNVSFINAEVKVVQCTINNVSVDITANQIGALSAVSLLDKMDRLVGKNHCFKRSLLLIKAWCLYESKTYVDGTILGARGGALSTYALNTMVMSLFNTHWKDISHPLQALFLFLEVFSTFDWRYNAVSITGPVSLSTMQLHPSVDGTQHQTLLDNKTVEGLRGIKLCDSPLNSHRHNEVFVTKAEGFRPQISAGNNLEVFLGAEKKHATVEQSPAGKISLFSVKPCNVIDPLNSCNNVARSVTAKSLIDIKKALMGGKNRLAEILCSKGGSLDFKNHLAESEIHLGVTVESLLGQVDCVQLDEFFSKSWRQYGCGDGYRPDLLMHPRQQWHGGIRTSARTGDNQLKVVDLLQSNTTAFRFV